MSGRRPYRLGKRAASVAETKSRILEAATAEYAEHGIAGTSMQAVARRADVAPGTVLYHYATPDDLAEAVVNEWIEQIEPPTAASIDPTWPLERRIAALVDGLYDTYERSSFAYRIYQKSPEHPVLAARRSEWDENIGALLAVALGEPAADPTTVQVVSVLVDPGFRGTLIARGMAPDRAAAAATQLILAWMSSFDPAAE